MADERAGRPGADPAGRPSPPEATDAAATATAKPAPAADTTATATAKPAPAADAAATANPTATTDAGTTGAATLGKFPAEPGARSAPTHAEQAAARAELAEPPGARDRVGPAEARRPLARDSGLGHAPWILALSSLGVVLVALGYAGGRYQQPFALAAYWTGQVVVFTPVVLRLLTRRPAGVTESAALVIGLAVNQYLLKWCYSPDQFRFPDELQHWLATTIINQSGELFRPDQALPPAVHFPGLAEIGAAVSQLTGLPVTAAGFIVAGVCRLAFVAALFAAVLRASRSPAVAGLACVLYATSPHYLFFNSMYLYQTAALTFMMLTIWAYGRLRAGGGRQFAALAVAGVLLTTICHHVTAGALVLTLLLLAAAEIGAGRPRPWTSLVLPGVAVAVVATWIAFVARDVISYLGTPIDQAVRSISQVAGGQQATSAASQTPLWQLGVQALGLLYLLRLFLAATRETLARQAATRETLARQAATRDTTAHQAATRDTTAHQTAARDTTAHQAAARDVPGRRANAPWQWAALAGSAVFFAGNGVRFLGSNGPELAGRLSTFTYLPMAITAAAALVHGARLIPPREPGRRVREGSQGGPEGAGSRTPRWLVPSSPPDPAARRVTPRLLAGAAAITLLMAGARFGGWPPPAQLLPGPYRVGAFERSIDAYGVAAAGWEYRTLGPGRRTGGDLTAIALASTYGRQDPVRGTAPLFYADQWSDDDENLVERLALGYLVVDRRLGEQLPAVQQYFDDDPRAGRITAPLTARQLGKFDDLPGWSRLYDNGQIRVYQVGDR